MTLLFDFIETEFGLLPVESRGESVTYIPPFVAFVGEALWNTSVWVSLYGEEHDFDGKDTVPGRYPDWRKFHVQNRSDDISRAKRLIRQAFDNYKRNQGHPNREDMIFEAERRWLDERNRETARAARQRLLDSL